MIQCIQGGDYVLHSDLAAVEGERDQLCASIAGTAVVPVTDAGPFVTMAMDTRQERDALKAENGRLLELLNTPENNDFLVGGVKEAGHQRERWGEDHDMTKTAGDWSLLLDKINGKQCQGVWDEDWEKLKHHLITMAAICANYHRCIMAREALSHKEKQT